MKPYSGGVRHDYKDSLWSQRRTRNRRWSWFVAGLSVPLCVAVLLLSERNESAMAPEPAARGGSVAASTSSDPATSSDPTLTDSQSPAATTLASATPPSEIPGATVARIGLIEDAIANRHSETVDLEADLVAVAARDPDASTPPGSPANDASTAATATATATIDTAAPQTLPSADEARMTAAGTDHEPRSAVESSRAAAASAPALKAGSFTTIPLALPENGYPVTLDYSDSGQDLPSAAALNLIVDRGDTLDRLFRRNGLSITDLHAMVNLDEASRHLRHLQPGNRIAITHEDGRVLSLSRELDEIRLLTITRGESGYAAQTIDRDVEIRVVGAHGVIRSSPFLAARAAGVSDTVIMNMAEQIFQWDIDFHLDVRQGDEFTVIYEELWRDGEKLRDGQILAAEFINRGRSYRAARFVDPENRSHFFTPDGRSVRRAFLRAPLEFTRISSNFDPNRRHPVLNTIRAHRGVDYAAPTGTPIRAAGDGRIQFRGVQGGYGNTIIIEHGGGITTLYAHMSRFGEYRQGSRVQQGQVIGYVGMTGLATGPHLHYEYRVNGVHRNPTTVPLPDADPIPATYRAEFERETAPLWRQLELYQRATRLASLD